MVLERILLQTIKFDLQVEHPYQFLLKYAKQLKGKEARFFFYRTFRWKASLCNDLMAFGLRFSKEENRRKGSACERAQRITCPDGPVLQL